jgi:hypothetical protein
VLLETLTFACKINQDYIVLTPAASDSTKHENRGSICDGTGKSGITGGGQGAGAFWPKCSFINSTTACIKSRIITQKSRVNIWIN